MVILSIAVAALTSTVLMPPTLRVLERLNVVDVASARSSHKGVAVRGTGIALTLGILAGLLVALIGSTENRMLIMSVVGIGILAACLGLAEDTRGLSIRVRLSGQLGLSIILGASVAIATGMHWIFIPVIAVLGVAYINMSNFMDGLNGMSGFQGGVAGIAFVSIGIMSGLSWLIVVGALLATVFVAFLPWNLGRQGTFLGDSGSYLLGATHIGLACAAVAVGIPILAAFGSTAIYVADTVSTLMLRARNGDKLTTAHRGHVYQRLNNLGWTHVATSATVAGFSALTTVTGLFTMRGGNVSNLAALMIIIGATTAYVALPTFVGILGQKIITIKNRGNRNNA